MAKKGWLAKGADGKSFGARLYDLIVDRGINQAELSKETGIVQSALSGYVSGTRLDPDDDTNRDYRAPDCSSIIALARYFSVSTDYLLGITGDPSIHPTATDDLQISAKAIQQMHSFAVHEKKAAELSLLMEDRLFWSILREIIAYKNATIAEGIYDSIALKHYTSDDDSCIAESIAESRIEEGLSVALNDTSLDEAVRRYLSSLIYLRSLPYDDQGHSDAAYALNFVPSEIHEQRARNYLSDMLERANPENPIHGLRRVYTEVAKSGHIHYDQDGNAHYSPKRRKDDE